jgi:hypothetical protein
MMHVGRSALWAGPLCVVLAASCAHTVNETDRVCTPGNYVFCRCKDGSEGTKQCNDDAQTFAPCDACQPGNEETPQTDLDASIPPDDDASQGGNDATPQPDVADEPPPNVAKPGPGDVLITEVLYDPSGTEPDEEWFEVYNTTTAPMSLAGLTVKDGGNRTATIGSGVIVAPNAYGLFVRSKSAATAAAVPAASILYEYGAGAAVTSGIILANSTGGAVWLVDGTTVIAGAQYGGWFSQTAPGGKSIQLHILTLDASGQKASWCLSQSSWATGSDDGTPGDASDCP